MNIIFERGGHIYTAYLNAFLETPSRRSLYVPGVMDLGWKHVVLMTLPGGVKTAIGLPQPLGSKAGALIKMHNLIIETKRRCVKCFIGAKTR